MHSPIHTFLSLQDTASPAEQTQTHEKPNVKPEQHSSPFYFSSNSKPPASLNPTVINHHDTYACTDPFVVYSHCDSVCGRYTYEYQHMADILTCFNAWLSQPAGGRLKCYRLCIIVDLGLHKLLLDDISTVNNLISNAVLCSVFIEICN